MRKIKLLSVLALLILLVACSNTYAEEDNVYYPIGDSITWLDGNKYAGTNETAIGYPSIIKDELNFDGVINKGVDGGSLAENANYPDNGSILLDNDWDDLNLADTVTILVGTNDFKLNVPIGDITDGSYDESTFTGAYQTLIEKIKDENPDSKVFLITPLQRNNDDYDINTVNEAGHKLVDYADRVKELGEKYDYEVIDLYSNSEITMDTLDKYTVDGLHPNNEGFEVLASEILEAIK